jgi:hypothetical protein
MSGTMRETMRRAMISAALRSGVHVGCAALCLGGAALMAACSEGDKRMPLFGSKSSSPWNELRVSGVEFAISTESSPPYRSWGGARIDGAGGYLQGKEAFDATRGRVGSDATALATLAMLFLDDGVAGKKPWTQPIGGATPPQQDAIARPPAVTGDTLVYWRAHAQAADLVRCRLALSTEELTCEIGSKVLQSAREAKDPATAAREDLASDNLVVRLRGIEALGKVGDDAARAKLLDLALHAYQPDERRAAVTVLGKVGGVGVAAALSRVLRLDKGDEVRLAAATVLGALRDPTAREALQQAQRDDTDGQVRHAATDALGKLK